jgi:hypothetical protein
VVYVDRSTAELRAPLSVAPGAIFEILDIRGGKKPRPNGYEKIYWDLKAADMDPGRGTKKE